MILFLLLQAAAPQSPDIVLDARVQARSLTIEKRGNASLQVTANPDGGSFVDIRAPKANGRKTLRNVDVNVRAEAHIGEGKTGAVNNSGEAETSSPAQR